MLALSPRDCLVKISSKFGVCLCNLVLLQSSKIEVSTTNKSEQEQGVKKKSILSQTAAKAAVQTESSKIKRTSLPIGNSGANLRKTSGFLALETMTPWGVVLKPVDRFQFSSENQSESSEFSSFEKSQIKSLDSQKVVYKRVSRSGRIAVESQPEPEPEPIPIISEPALELPQPDVQAEAEVRRQCKLN